MTYPQRTLESFLNRREKLIVGLVMALAALRILVFIAAFPFFNNVDEQPHFDIVRRYCSGDFPGEAVSLYSRQSAEAIVLYGTSEFYHSPDKITGGVFPPPLWTEPDVVGSSSFRSRVGRWLKRRNHEAGSLPLPHFLAGLWCQGGQALGISGGNLLYWIRAMNVPIFVLLVWLSWGIAGVAFQGDVVQRIGVSLVVAFFPQDLFYAITNDNFSALFFALAFYLLLQIYLSDRSVAQHLVAGLAVGAAFVSKIANAPVLALLGLILILRSRRLVAAQRLGGDLPKLVALVGSAAIPMGAIFLRNYYVLGDITGTAAVIEYTGWTVKPIGELLEHPIFSLDGLGFFLSELVTTFWRGEFVWHGKRSAHGWADIVYVVSTAVFFACSAVSFARRKSDGEENRRIVLALSFSVVAASVLYLVFLSTHFDFGDWFYPSKELPYFISGRLVSCVTVPFFIIYLDGANACIKPWGGQLGVLASIVLLVLTISLSEILLALNVFESAYNWFHL